LFVFSGDEAHFCDAVGTYLFVIPAFW
jgi:hypothetical protein